MPLSNLSTDKTFLLFNKGFVGMLGSSSSSSVTTFGSVVGCCSISFSSLSFASSSFFALDFLIVVLGLGVTTTSISSSLSSFFALGFLTVQVYEGTSRIILSGFS